eukprot:TRINITY_DN101895_c0_g1_i1.p1 TRINITY_DN101895_c0_g1~~TRINITY_DN101895_c0_g1_i1.p1  ORF type:complete len:343 (+),score=63.60 TRINITY_DN101895_c0_g1_i1:149-1030(+)
MAMMERPRPAPAAAPAPVATVLPAEAATAPPPAAVVEPAPVQTSVEPAIVEPASAPPAEVVAPAAVASAPPATVPAPVAAAPAAAPAVRRPTTLNASERREAGMLAELYSILVSTEHLEGAFVRGAVSNQDYERHIMQILAQFKTLQNGLRDKCPDVKAFIQDHSIKCPLAEERLLGTGVAATTLYSAGTTASGKESLACFKASENFITLIDALNMKLSSVDELMPLVRDLQASIVSIPNLPKLNGLDRIAGWLVTLNSMKAADRIDEAQSRQLAMDVEQAYTAMKNWLQEKT